MSYGVRPKNPDVDTTALEANKEIGYSENNPEPPQLRDASRQAPEPDALEAALEYIDGGGV